MTSIVAFFGCFLALLPAFALGGACWTLEQVTGRQGLGALGRIAGRALLLLLSPAPFVGAFLIVLALVAFAAVPALRGWGFLLLGVAGLACFTQIFISLGWPGSSVIVLIPSLLALALSLWSAWLMLAPALGG